MSNNYLTRLAIKVALNQTLTDKTLILQIMAFDAETECIRARMSEKGLQQGQDEAAQGTTSPHASFYESVWNFTPSGAADAFSTPASKAHARTPLRKHTGGRIVYKTPRPVRRVQTPYRPFGDQILRRLGQLHPVSPKPKDFRKSPRSKDGEDAWEDASP